MGYRHKPVPKRPKGTLRNGLPASLLIRTEAARAIFARAR
jgi:hypothetical protein